MDEKMKEIEKRVKQKYFCNPMNFETVQRDFDVLLSRIKELEDHLRLEMEFGNKRSKQPSERANKGEAMTEEEQSWEKEFDKVAMGNIIYPYSFYMVGRRRQKEVDEKKIKELEEGIENRNLEIWRLMKLVEKRRER